LIVDRPALAAIATVFGAAILPAALILAFAGTKPVDTPGTAGVLLYLGLITTAVAYLLWSTGLPVLALGETVTLTMLEPVAATVLAMAVLPETASPATGVGIVMALTGVWIATAPGRSRMPGTAVHTASSAAHGGFAPAREQVIAETLDANVSAAINPSGVNVSSRPPR